jgi:hypothetical protein
MASSCYLIPRQIRNRGGRSSDQSKGSPGGVRRPALSHDGFIVSTPSATECAGIFASLHDAERVNELDAEHWISRWEREAEASGRARDDHYWSDAWDWITEQ